MQIFAGFAGEGASNESVVVANGDFRLFRSLSSEHFSLHMEIYTPSRSFLASARFLSPLKPLVSRKR